MRYFSHKKRTAGRWSCMAAAVMLALSALGATRSNKAEITRNLDIFNSVFKELQLNYVDSIDAEKSIKTAIQAMLNDIDPYTEYYPASDQEDLTIMTSGEYGGIGAVIAAPTRGKGVIISDPYEGSPAALAGLHAGDRLLVIDGDSVSTWTTAQVSAKLKGQAGTKLKVTVVRPYANGDSVLTFDITRRKIQMPAVPYYGVVRGDLGYIDLTSFTDKSAADVREALLSFKNNPAVKGIVLDLRGNGGGLLEEAVKIVGMFVPKGTEVLRTRGKGQLSDKIYKTTAAPIDTKIPLAVLIDGYSASASEITAGALQDLDRAVIIGDRSFGKGLVQSTRPIPYDGMLKVTIAKYYIPSGRLIQAIDYSHRNPDGSVARTPDSLTNEFTTFHGRKVRDGGGITPDVKVTAPEINRLVFNILRDNWAFDYATRYASQHDTVTAPEIFVVTDSLYDDFKKFIDPAEFKYDKVCEQMLVTLREAAKTEGYESDSLTAQLDVLEGMLKHDLNRDLDRNRVMIEGILAEEILRRYYHQRGEIIESLKRDEALNTASKVLNDPAEYARLLAPAK